MEKRILVYGMTNLKGGIESYIMNIYRNLDYSKIIFDFICDFSEIAYYEEIKKWFKNLFYSFKKKKFIFSFVAVFQNTKNSQRV